MEYQKIIFLEHDGIRTYDGGVFNEPTPRERNELYTGSIIPLSLLNTHILKLSNRLSPDELKIQVEIRMFEEGNLKSDEEYTIDFIEHTINSDDSILVEVFALSHTKSNEFYAESLKHSPIIDRITPGFMIYHNHYLTHPPKNDLFIYLGDEESYVAIYQNGRYIAHRSIETLASIAVETGLDLPRLKQYLATRGILEEHYPPEEFGKFNLIQERITKNVERIVHTINHKRGLFSLSGIDRIHLDFEGESIPGLDEAFKAFGIDAVIAPLKGENTHPSMFHDTLCAQYLATTQAVPLNLSHYLRKAAWYTRESGKFLASLGGSLAIVLLSALFLMWMMASEETTQQELNTRLETLKNETKTLSAQLSQNKKLLQEQNLKNQTLQEEIALFHGAEETALLINDIQTQRQHFLHDVATEMGRYRLGALLLEQNSSKEMRIHVVSDYRKRDNIAKLMRGLYERGYQNVQTHEIKLDENTTTYGSIVEVIR